MKKLDDGSVRRKLGRPPKPPDEVRSERVVSFVTRRELKDLVKIADDSGESLSSAVHRILRTALLKENRDIPG